MPDSIQPDLDRRIDLYVRGELSPSEARELAQEALRRPDLFEELNAAALAKAAVESGAWQTTKIDRLPHYVSGQLSPMEERALAREALSDDQLFDALAAHGAVEKALDNPVFRDAISKTGRPARSKVRVFAIAGSIAAAIALFTFYIKWDRPAGPSSRPTIAQLTLKPTLDPSASAGQPILLASQLRPTTSSTPIFRGVEPESRPPQQQGAILSIEEKLATVNLGSLDGLAKGNELSVFRGGQPIGRIVVSTIFRDRARGGIAGETIRVGDQVRAGDSVYLSAVLQQVDALTARAELKKAIDVAEKALAQLGTNSELLERIAALEYQTGALDAALRHYQAAAPQQAAALNSLAVLYLLRGDYQRAEALLSGKSDGESLNNLGAAAELRGDSQKAAQYYGEALRALDGSAVESRKSVQENLTRAKGLK